ncbi:MAG: hypothetical protein RIM84_22820 [Alphaproteobacteria bacterium]
MIVIASFSRRLVLRQPGDTPVLHATQVRRIADVIVARRLAHSDRRQPLSFGDQTRVAGDDGGETALAAVW